MNIQEFEAWKQETERSRHHWVVDEVKRQNSGDILIHKGGESGQFVWIRPDGEASVGTYEGAIPHIGEAAFKILHSRRFESQDEAFKTLVERAGLKFLLDVLGLPSYK